MPNYKPEETLNLRIKNKIDTITNWNNCDKTILNGEIIIAVDEKTNQKHILIGDGDVSKPASTLLDNLITDDYIKGLFGTNS